jgi:hypothetical protein
MGGSLQNAVNQAQPGDVRCLAGKTQVSETVNLALMRSAGAFNQGLKPAQTELDDGCRLYHPVFPPGC